MSASQREPIFVFGSNQAGRHGAGAALTATRWYGAQPGVGDGPTGQAYALPTKGLSLQVLPLGFIKTAVARFKEYASANPALRFKVTRIGCGLAGYRDEDIVPFFSDAPANCVLPYLWQMKLGRVHGHRIVVAGSRGFDQYGLLAEKLDRFLSNLPSPPTIVSGGAPGADRLGERYAKDRGIALLVFRADWKRYGREAGVLRNQVMAWAASKLVAFWDGNSPGTKNMIGAARAGGLNLRRVIFKESAHVG